MNTLTITTPRQAVGPRSIAPSAWIGVLRTWQQRMRQRRQLGDLDDWQLDDIGISRQAAQLEAAKPFWRA